MWLCGDLCGFPVMVCVVYLVVANGAHSGNADIMRYISEDVNRWTGAKEVLILGDVNGHIQSIDGYEDSNGSLLLETAWALSLEVLNLRPDCEGEFTWCARTSRSSIDYALASPRLAQHVRHIHIDEEGRFSIGSDHNRIKLTISSSVWRPNMNERRAPAVRYLPKAA
ncbi:hypothetical protein HPB50_022808 [Hyalomma asiaticum]|uniref:Uncharacterized protein n=1 Tax=Hyalomma asiaticum TaxID=266040 RepID=A0ACB7TM77_HYAAI|nr:hypothetical protein HPB50_022808 [Hyalomma asiaticum]